MCVKGFGGRGPRNGHVDKLISNSSSSFFVLDERADPGQN